MKRTPVKKRRTKPRRGPLRHPEYRKWLSTQLCVVGTIQCTYPVDPAHTVNNGMSSKGDDSSCAPLCRYHHRVYDNDRKTFEQIYDLNMRNVAKDFYDRYNREVKA